ncbi:MCE family protein [Mycolicibacterium sp.]|uniref:MCE family protein n=1 Tax=Mycolicibacterium sp. TaxID=2320850 RepID=UPI003D0992C9
MSTLRVLRTGLAVVLCALLLAGGAVVTGIPRGSGAKTHITAYFDNSNGLFAGDEVRVLGVPVGEVQTIEPQPDRTKVTFWVLDKYAIPADAEAVIISPQLVTARAIALTPAYTGGDRMADGATIPQHRTAVPVEWDDLRSQLEKLAEALQPIAPGGVSSLGALINTAADNLRGQGPTIRDTVIKMSQAFSALGDHSGDLFATVKNLSVLVSALQSSSDLMAQLNLNLASITSLLVDDADEVSRAVSDLNTAVGDVKSFVADNRDTIVATSEKLSAVTQTVVASIDDIEQILHLAPNATANLSNIYQPAQAGLTGALAVNNFANPIEFICGAVQAASRLSAEQSAKLCVQYLAPIVKNRQYNFLPFGVNPFVGASARPNEITYSEDWLRPDFVPAAAAAPPGEHTGASPPLPAEAAAEATTAVTIDPASGLSGMMMPAGAGS